MHMDDQKNFKRAINLDIVIIKIKNRFMSYFKRATMRRTFLSYGIKNTLEILYAIGTQRVTPSWQDIFIFSVWVANYSAGFGIYSPLTELAI